MTDKPVDGITRAEFRERVDRLAREAGLRDANEALAKLDSGELEGTLLETNIRVLRSLSTTPLYEELTQDRIVKRLEDQARERFDMSAQEMIDAFKRGELDDLSDILDLVGLATMLDVDHRLYVEL